MESSGQRLNKERAEAAADRTTPCPFSEREQEPTPGMQIEESLVGDHVPTCPVWDRKRAELSGRSYRRSGDGIFPREGRLWNFGGTHKTHKRFVTESTGMGGHEKESKTQEV